MMDGHVYTLMVASLLATSGKKMDRISEADIREALLLAKRIMVAAEKFAGANPHGTRA